MNNKFKLTEEELRHRLEEELLDENVKLLNKNSKIMDVFPNAQIANPLETSAALGKIWKMKGFLNQGVDINSDLGRGNTLLHVAALNGQFEMTCFLVENGANYKAVNNEGKTPLDLVKAFMVELKSGASKDYIIPINRNYAGILAYLENIR